MRCERLPQAFFGAEDSLIRSWRRSRRSSQPPSRP
jgi:hypothetical protein